MLYFKKIKSILINKINIYLFKQFKIEKSSVILFNPENEKLYDINTKYLFWLTNEEIKQLEHWWAIHKQTCKAKCYSLKFNSCSGIGSAVHVICESCHAHEDITDVSAW